MFGTLCFRSLLAGHWTVKFRHYCLNESGAITAYSTFIFLLMMAFVGMTIDMMRHESIRVRLQGTSDNAVLAAADLDQEQDAEFVVNDHFVKAKMDQYVEYVDVSRGINFRTVETKLKVTMPTWFMNMLGTDSIPVYAGSRAEERVQNIEVSLVLDISGSMGGNNKIQNLRKAAKEFTETLIDNNSNVLDDGTGLTSISIIPYHAVVNVPDSIMNRIPVTSYQEFSNCVRFDPSDFNSLSLRLLDPDALAQPPEYDRIAHFDPWNSSLNEVNGDPTIARPWCQSDTYGEILPHSVSIADLTAKIDELGAGGNTAIDLGLKWAAALLDPSTRPLTDQLIASNDLSSDVDGRPAAYTDAETIKVVVLMTDGRNTTQYDLKDPFKWSMSPVWYSDDEDKYTVYHDRPETNADWYDPLTSQWRNAVIGEDDAVQLSHAQLYSDFSVRYIADTFFAGIDANLYNKYRNAFHGYTGWTTADTYSKQVCDALKAQDVMLFTIGFEAPVEGQNLMRYCASTAGHYFDVNGVEISEAFNSIANTIQQLRLTQ